MRNTPYQIGKTCSKDLSADEEPESCEEVADLCPQQLVDGLRLVGDGELHGGDDGGPHQRRLGGEGGLQLGQQGGRRHQAKLSKAFCNNIPRPLFRALSMLAQVFNSDEALGSPDDILIC